MTTRPFDDIVTPSADKPILIPLPPHGALPASDHVLDRASALALKAALAAGRPLLLRGEPGTGKSQLARAAAAMLNRRLLPYVVDARTEPRDLLYTIDAVSRLAQAQLTGVLGKTDPKALAALDVLNFVVPGPLWRAYRPKEAAEQAQKASVSLPDAGDERPVVLLIDEIDKADPSVPNGLLDAFGNGSFSVEGRFSIEASEPRPLVILTTNEERALPDAFVRRCLVHTLVLPDAATRQDDFIASLVQRGKANIPGASPEVLTQAAEAIAERRVALKDQGVCLPGVAEYIDLLRAVTTLASEESQQLELLKELKTFTTCKHPEEVIG